MDDAAKAYMRSVWAWNANFGFPLVMNRKFHDPFFTFLDAMQFEINNHPSVFRNWADAIPAAFDRVHDDVDNALSPLGEDMILFTKLCQSRVDKRVCAMLAARISNEASVPIH